MSLIEELGGYEQAKAFLAAIEYKHMEKALLAYRRENNIFEVGDYFVNYADDAVYTALFIENNRMHGKSGDKNVWTYFGRFGLRHATDAEIKAGHRL